MRVILLVLLVACRAADRPQPGPLPPDDSQARAAYDAQQWDRCAELYAALGTADALYNAACCHARGGKPDQALATLERAISAGFRNTTQLRSDTDFAALHADPRWQATLASVQARVAAWEKTLRDPALRRELLELMVEDQAAREAWTDLKDNVQSERVDASDRKTTARMKDVIAKYGWPGKGIVGEDGAHAAWLFVQHATADLAFQKQCLVLIESAVHAGEATAADYAYLYDRVAMQDKRPQRYGTQYINGEPAPIEDPDHVDERRKAIGLAPMAEYRKQMQEAFGSGIR